MDNKYSEYRKTQKWKDIAKKRMEIDGYKCCMCEANGSSNNRLEIHHLSYRYLYHEEDRIYQDLCTLCEACHAQVHKLMNRITGEDGKRGWSSNPNIPNVVHTFNISGQTEYYEESENE